MLGLCSFAILDFGFWIAECRIALLTRIKPGAPLHSSFVIYHSAFTMQYSLLDISL